MNEQDVYEFYNNTTKIVYVDIEARGNIAPVELLFEIHAAFDHLKRFHLGEKTEDEACQKALIHLKRASLDGYKLILYDFHEHYNKLIGHDTEHLRMIDNGQFLPKAIKLRNQIVDTARTARKNEGVTSIEESFDYWNRVYALIIQFEKEFLDDDKIDWAKIEGKTKARRSLRKDVLLALIVGIIAGIIATVIYNHVF
ncbi:MAG: hypothetical protein LBJ91_03695 [Clostridiales Family XIII bacterium]|jgi:hypothetical protein|nr:hypothetical protein [Clostridiales Family XIII bacterium]